VSRVAEKIKIQCYSLPSKPKEFLAYIEEKLATIPKRFRASAQIEFEHESGCGYDSSCDYWLEVTYWRPERAAEKRKRQDNLKRLTDRQEARDRAELKRLQVIYGGTK
jgi:hypothetical protein